MKIIVALILLTLSVSILSPLSFEVNSAESDTPVILTLNVCNTTDIPLSGGSDLPCFCALRINFSQPLQFSYLDIYHQIFSLPLITFEAERPPRV